MSLSDSVKKIGFRKAYEYLDKDPDANIPKLMDWVDKFAGDGPSSFPDQRAAFRRVIENPDNNWYQLIKSMWTDIDDGVRRAFFENFILNGNLIGWKKQEEARTKYGCNIPWAILLDPTSACNLHCTGCWAAEYGNKLNLSFDEIDSIITQGKELGVYIYIYTGGEPMVRRNDLIALCNKHHDCEFLCFTNATLIDEAFADEMLRVKNFVPAISVEGFEEATDSRRGEGVFQKVRHAMDILKAKKLPFGVSCCYTSANMESISSENFVDGLVAWGAKFAWYFHYMPVGNDAAPELLPTPEQREELYHRVREGFWFCVKVATVFLLAAGAVGFVFAPQLIALFRDDPEVISIGTVALRFQCVTFFFQGWITMSNMMLQTIGRTVPATFIAMARQGVFFIPLVWILSLSPLGLLGIQMSQSVSDLLTLAVAIPTQLYVLRQMARMQPAKV